MLFALPVLALAIIAGIVYVQKHEAPPPVRESEHFPRGEAAYFAGDYDAAIAAFLESIAAQPRDPRPYYRLVDAHARRGDLDAVEPVLLSLLAADSTNARAYYGLGALAVRREDLDAGLRAGRRAVALDPFFGYGYLLLGSVHNYAGRPREAVQAWRRARKVFRDQGNREDEAWALNRIALIHRQRGDFRKAIADFAEALSLQRALDDRSAQVVVLGNLGLTQADLGDLEQAMQAFRQARAFARETGDRESECWILSNLAFLDILAGRYHRAIACSDTSIALARELDDPYEEVSGLLNRATAYVDLGNPVQALAACREALPIAESVADPRHRAGVLLVMADAYRDLGRLDRARAHYAQCDSVYRDIGLASGAGSAVCGLCEVAVQEGDTTYAVTTAERTLQFFADAGYAEGEELVALLLSRLTLHRGEPDRALAFAHHAVQLSERDGRRSRAAIGRIRAAAANLALGNRADAETDARLGQQLARAVRNPDVIWLAEMTLADVLRDSDPEGALEHYRAAMDAVESSQRQLRLEEFKARMLQNRIELYFKAADLLLELDRPAEALIVCERARARALSDFLAASPEPVAPRVPSRLAARHEALEATLRTQRASLAALAAVEKPDMPRIATLERAVARTRQQRDDVRTQILLQDARYGAVLPGAAIPDAAQIVRTLDPGVALLEYFLGPQQAICFVVGDGQVRAVRLPVSEAELSRDVDALRQPLLAPRSVTTLAFDTAAARRLREVLLDPVLPLLGETGRETTRLIVVPDGPLHYLPLEMLFVAPPAPAATAGAPTAADTLFAAFGRAAFVGSRYTVSYLPSASWLVLADATRTGDTAPTARRSLLALGSPPGADGLVPAARLRFADREARSIAARFPDAVLRIGTEATERDFKTLAPEFQLLHLASHGVVDERIPLYSGLVLGSDAAAAAGGDATYQDGFLHAYEVLDLPLHCELTTLSACQTGMGRYYAGEGLLGLTRSFLYAGSRRMLVSLWSVNDASTAILMEHFYAHLARGRDAAAALQQAKVELRETVVTSPNGQSLSYAHPFFWAAFVLIGEP